MCDRYSCIFYQIPTKSPLITPLKLLNTLFITLVFSKQNGVSVKLSNNIKSSQRHKAFNVFANKKNCHSGCTNRGAFKYFQIKVHVQIACECHDLNLDFLSFDSGFKQLCVTNFMQEYILCEPLMSDEIVDSIDILNRIIIIFATQEY